MGRKPKVPIRIQKEVVLDYIKDNPNNPYLTQGRIATDLSINPATLSKIIAVLLAEGKIKVVQVGTANVLTAVVVEEDNDGSQ